MHADARLVCNVCIHNWCKVCRMVWHDGMSCEQNARTLGEQAADHGFAEYEKNNKALSVFCWRLHWAHFVEEFTGSYKCFLLDNLA